MSFGTKTEKQEVKEQKFISPGVNEVKITAIEAGKSSSKGTPFVKVSYENKQGQTTDDSLYFTDLTKERSSTILGNFKEAVAPGTDEITAETLEQFAKLYFKVIGNKWFRHRFTAEEIEGKAGEDGTKKPNWFKAKTGYKFSTEAISVNPTRLKPLDPNNQYDYQRLPVSTTVSTNGHAKETVTEGLPF